jgi:hypothetical protein
MGAHQTRGVLWEKNLTMWPISVFPLVLGFLLAGNAHAQVSNTRRQLEALLIPTFSVNEVGIGRY